VFLKRFGEVLHSTHPTPEGALGSIDAEPAHVNRRPGLQPVAYTNCLILQKRNPVNSLFYQSYLRGARILPRFGLKRLANGIGSFLVFIPCDSLGENVALP
jgi:hypothetical protein